MQSYIDKMINKEFSNGEFTHESFDRLYLKPLLDMIKSKRTNSDLIIEYNIKNTKELVDFLIN